MPSQQLDLFSGAGHAPDPAPPATVERGRREPATLGDEALIAAIPEASVADCPGLVTEAGRRRLQCAVPALERLCRRFKGFGLERAVPEQTAALQGLREIGGRAAVEAVARIIADQIVQGPGLRTAIHAAAKLGATLPSGVVVPLLRHAEPDIRAYACRCVRPSPEVFALLVELLDDLHGSVAQAAACALGHLGRSEGRPALVRLLRDDPSIEAIDALSRIADEECLVLLGAVARARADLALAVLTALDSMEEPWAARIAAAVRNVTAAWRESLP